MSARLFAVSAVLFLAPVAMAGPVFVVPGAGQYYSNLPPGPSPYIEDSFDTQYVPPWARVTDQHRDQGVIFEHTALARVGLFVAWAPTGSQYAAQMPFDPQAETLNFSPGFNGVVSMRFVDPETGRPVGYDRVTLTFLGVPAERSALSVRNGDYESATWGANPLYGTYVGQPPDEFNPFRDFTRMTAEAPPGIGITHVDAYTQLFFPDWPDPLPPWGIASIELGNVVPDPEVYQSGVAGTPEPSTLLLAGVGIGGLAAVRRRCTSTVACGPAV